MVTYKLDVRTVFLFFLLVVTVPLLFVTVPLLFFNMRYFWFLFRFFSIPYYVVVETGSSSTVSVSFSVSRNVPNVLLTVIVETYQTSRRD